MSDSKDSCTSDSNDTTSQSSQSSNFFLKSSMLRPSAFGASLNPVSDTTNLKGNLVEDPKLNPFLREDKSEEDDEEKQNKCTEKSTVKSPDTEKKDPLSLLSKNGLPKFNFLQTAKSSIPLVESSGFVFGQNVHERVIADNIQTNVKSGEDDKSLSTSSKETGETGESSSGLLFSSVIQNSKNENQSSPIAKESNKSLTEIAREYEESRAQKRKYEEVETFTGEENEVNVVDFNCKLFAFVNRNWEERGRGSLRLNDSKEEDGISRVVFRTGGNLRLLVNTKIWSGMVAERPSQKSLRFTAIDNAGQIRVFLVMSRPDDISGLHNALTYRIAKAKKAAEENKSTTEEHENGQSKLNESDKAEKPDSPEKEDSSESGNNDLDEPSPKKKVVEVIAETSIIVTEPPVDSSVTDPADDEKN